MLLLGINRVLQTENTDQWVLVKIEELMMEDEKEKIKFNNSLVIDSGDTLVFTPSREWIGNKKRWYNIEELINDSIDDDDKFQFISFVITGEK